jgi:glycosyltransferase involved in cell wall biosynthesis
MGHLPYVSVVMAVRQEANHIRASLGAILSQDYPADQMEVIVSDGMSSDGTREIILEEAARCVHLRMIDNPMRIVPTGLNEAIRHASGEIIVRVDGHTIVPRNYVRCCVEELVRTGADNVGGRMVGTGSGRLDGSVALATQSPFGVGDSRFHYSDREEWTDAVYLGAWPRAVFGRVGLFDEELVRDQDDEFNYRIRERGGRILLSPRIRSHYSVRSRISSLAKQYFEYGLWKIRVLQKHPGQMRARQFVPPAFVLALVGGMVTAPWWPLGRASLGLLVAAYLTANLSVSWWLTARHGARYALTLPAVFATLHLSYGAGFLAGLFRFAGRWKDRHGRTPMLGSLPDEVEAATAE